MTDKREPGAESIDAVIERLTVLLSISETHGKDDIKVTHSDLSRLIEAHENLIEKAEAVLEWYDRDGATGTIGEPMENMRAILTAHRGEKGDG